MPDLPADVTPVTVESLTADLRTLGVGDGATLLVHSSLRSMGWVCGGAHAAVLALRAAVGPAGTIVVPTHSTDWSDPSSWEDPPVPASWWSTIRASMPAFDRALTPPLGMGAIPQAVLRLPDVRRSDHPYVSFAALGPEASAVVDGHRLDDPLGEGSPLARLYDLHAQVLLLGVGHRSNTSLHLAEYRTEWPGRRRCRRGAPVMVSGERTWVDYDDIDVDAEDFPALGAAFEAIAVGTTAGRAGRAEAKLLDQRMLVDFAVSWIATHRGDTGPAG